MTKDSASVAEGTQLAAKGTMSTTSLLALPPDVRNLLADHYPGATAALMASFETALWEGADAKAAASIAGLLEGVVHSSDIDFDYVPCVIQGVNVKSGLFAALGIDKTDRISVGGSTTRNSQSHRPPKSIPRCASWRIW
jgi:hypothetical protein